MTYKRKRCDAGECEIGGQSGQAPVSLTPQAGDTLASPASRQGGPSKAQIEAVAKALKDLDIADPFSSYEQLAKAALTAAAEAKPKPAQSQIEAVKDTLRRLVILTGDSPWDWDDVARKVLLAAAAEVGPKYEIQLDVWMFRKLKEHEAATIERCAQVAEGNVYKHRYRTWAHMNGGNRSIDSEIVRHSDAIAAAIRALKDKP